MAEPCYVLAYPDDTEHDDDEGTAHYRTLKAARESLAEFVDRDNLPEPKQLDQPCHTVECVECGYVYDEDDCMTYHWTTLAEGLDSVRHAGWMVVGERAWCQADDCQKAAPEGDPR